MTFELFHAELVLPSARSAAPVGATHPSAEYPICGGRMILIETFQAGCEPLHAPIIRIDTS